MKMSMKTICVLIISCLVSGSIMLFAQEEKPVSALHLKMEVRLLQVEAFAYDKNDDFVPGLTKDDFELWEDGKQQKIRYVDEIHSIIPDKTAEQMPAPGILTQA